MIPESDSLQPILHLKHLLETLSTVSLNNFALHKVYYKSVIVYLNLVLLVFHVWEIQNCVFEVVLCGVGEGARLPEEGHVSVVFLGH